MDEKEKEGKKKKKKDYVKPQVDIIKIDTDSKILVVSPLVEPGNGSVIVVPPEEDDDDTDILGAKRHSGYFPWIHGKFICKGEGKWSCPGNFHP